MPWEDPNPVAVEIAGRSGCKIVWMPTVDAENETAGLPTGGNKKLPFWAEIQRALATMGISPPRMRVIDESGQLVPQARLCLELIGRHDMILATGHLGRNGACFRPTSAKPSTRVCRQNTIGSVEGELRSHEIWDIQVDSFLKLDRAVKYQTSNDSHEVAPIEYFLFRSTGGQSAGCA
jgi:hypothetical protein